MNMSMVSPFFMEHGVYDNMLLSNITFLIFAILVVTLVATLTLTEHFKLLSFFDNVHISTKQFNNQHKQNTHQGQLDIDE